MWHTGDAPAFRPVAVDDSQTASVLHRVGAWLQDIVDLIVGWQGASGIIYARTRCAVCFHSRGT